MLLSNMFIILRMLFIVCYWPDDEVYSSQLSIISVIYNTLYYMFYRKQGLLILVVSCSMCSLLDTVHYVQNRASYM